jgi:MYXO-CTERM domain-containing protein
MRRTRWIPLAALAAVALAGSQAAAQNLLTNPGFEDAATFTADGPPFVGSWEAFNGGGGTFSVRDGVSPRNGGFDAHLSINNIDNSFAGLFQDVPVAAGQKVTYSGWNKGAPTPFGPGAEYRIEWRSTVPDTEVSRTSNLDPIVTADYTKFSRTETVPAGVNIARVVYAIQTFGGSTNLGEVFLDDFSVTKTPEPTTVALGLAGAALLAIRRRRA